MAETNKTKKIELKKGIAIIFFTSLITILFIYGFYINNYCSGGDDFRFAKKNELWAIITNFNLLNTPEECSDEKKN